MNEQKPIFREATVNDIQSIKTLTLNSYLQYEKLLTEENIISMKEGLGSDKTYEELFAVAKCFVCERNNEIIGSAFMIPKGTPWRWFEKEWAYIRLVAVKPEEGGKGIGKTLTVMCIDAAEKGGEQVLALHTSEFQSAAVHIYEQAGFKKLKDLEKVFGKQFYLYTKQLNTP